MQLSLLIKVEPYWNVNKNTEGKNNASQKLK